jgi:hypothetical protein
MYIDACQQEKMNGPCAVEESTVKESGNATLHTIPGATRYVLFPEPPMYIKDVFYRWNDESNSRRCMRHGMQQS